MSFEAFSWVWAGGANAAREYFRVYGAAGQVFLVEDVAAGIPGGTCVKRSALRCPMHCAAMAGAVRCEARCTALP